MNTNFLRAKGCFSKQIDGVLYVMGSDSKNVMELNETAGLIWTMLEKPRTKKSIIEEMLKEFDVLERVIIDDVSYVINKMLKLDLLTKVK